MPDETIQVFRVDFMIQANAAGDRWYAKGSEVFELGELALVAAELLKCGVV